MTSPTENQASNSKGSILISGASTGIGFNCATLLAEHGFRVYAGYRNPADAESLRNLHPNITPVELDITQQDSIQAVQNKLESELNGHGLIGLVNNAGIAVGGPLEFLPIESLRLQLEVNVIGQIALTQAMLPFLRTAKGRIVNMGSIAGLSAVPFVGPYGASKHALEALTDALRIELRPWGIQVAIIEPGVIDTPIWSKAMDRVIALESQFPPQAIPLYGRVLESLKIQTQKAAQRGISPEHVASAVLHALRAPKPRTRYLVGRDAHIRRWFSRLPDRWHDWLIVKKMGLPS